MSALLATAKVPWRMASASLAPLALIQYMSTPKVESADPGTPIAWLSASL